MTEKIQLIHPQGKKAIKMDLEKYELIKKYLLEGLKAGNELTQDQLRDSIIKAINLHKLKFEGSVEWHLEWVKLDLEARKLITRKGSGSPYKYSL